MAAATRAIAARAERLDPALATTAFVREDRDGKVFLDSTRAGGATVVGRLQPADPARACRCRSRSPGTTLDRSTPADFTVQTAAGLLGDRDPWAERCPRRSA